LATENFFLSAMLFACFRWHSSAQALSSPFVLLSITRGARIER